MNAEVMEELKQQARETILAATKGDLAMKRAAIECFAVATAAATAELRSDLLFDQLEVLVARKEELLAKHKKLKGVLRQGVELQIAVAAKEESMLLQKLGLQVTAGTPLLTAKVTQ